MSEPASVATAGVDNAVIRPAGERDLPGVDRVLDANEPPAADDAPNPDAFLAYLGYLLGRGRMLVAELDGSIVAFGTVVDIGPVCHLADLFVAPEHHGRGLGGRILAEIFENRWPRSTFSSADPRALPLYVRAGMAPLWPNLYLDGTADGLVAELEVRASDADETSRLEVEFGGVERSDDHAYWANRDGAEPFVVIDAGEIAAFGHARNRLRKVGRWIERLVLAPGIEDRSAAVVSAVAFAGRVGGAIGLCVPGPNPLRPCSRRASGSSTRTRTWPANQTCSIRAGTSSTPAFPEAGGLEISPRRSRGRAG